ncbi:MAG TPA: mercuric transporter MerT family protein [Stellaceae bacterium]|nr:mercuric transporter MerT family protein [Stellaceae bacterium]
MDGQIGGTIERAPAVSHRGAPTGLGAATGSLFGAVAASSCCILPLVLFTLGISGAWIGDLTSLEPYQPVFIAITLGFLAAGYYRVLRQPRIACAGAACARPLPRRIIKSALLAATVLVLAAIAFPYVAPPLLGV